MSLRRVLCSRIPRPGQPVELSPDEAGHATRVLRLGDGHLVEAIDGKGGAAMARLRVRGKSVWLDADPAAAQARGQGDAAGAGKGSGASAADAAATVLPITVELAVLKGEAMEWAVEKCVELGAERLAPVLTAHTVVQLGRKGPEEFQARWQKIADQALKQCGRLTGLVVEPPVPLEQRLAAFPQRPDRPRLWCDEGQRDGGEVPFLADWLRSHDTDLHQKVRSTFLLIGPEGGWSVPERGMIATAATAVSLGPLVLRAETAALFALSLAHAQLRKS